MTALFAIAPLRLEADLEQETWRQRLTPCAAATITTTTLVSIRHCGHVSTTMMIGSLRARLVNRLLLLRMLLLPEMLGGAVVSVGACERLVASSRCGR